MMFEKCFIKFTYLIKLFEGTNPVAEHVTHHAVTRAPPVTVLPHRQSTNNLAFARSELDALPASGVIHPSHSS